MLSEEEFSNESWDLMGRKVGKAALLHDIYETAFSLTSASARAICFVFDGSPDQIQLADPSKGLIGGTGFAFGLLPLGRNERPTRMGPVR